MLNESNAELNEPSEPKQSKITDELEEEKNNPYYPNSTYYHPAPGPANYYVATGDNFGPGYPPPNYYQPKKASKKGSLIKNRTLALLLTFAGLAAFFFISSA